MEHNLTTSKSQDQKRPQPTAPANTDAAVAELIHGAECAVRDHYFKEIYPAQIRERAAALLQFAERVDHLARTGNFRDLDFIDVTLKGVEEGVDAAREWSGRFIGRKL